MLISPLQTGMLYNNSPLKNKSSEKAGHVVENRHNEVRKNLFFYNDLTFKGRAHTGEPMQVIIDRMVGLCRRFVRNKITAKDFAGSFIGQFQRMTKSNEFRHTEDYPDIYYFFSRMHDTADRFTPDNPPEHPALYTASELKEAVKGFLKQYQEKFQSQNKPVK